MTRLFALLLFLAFASALSGCGIRGDLDRAPSLWGGDTASAEEDDEDEVSDDFEDEDEEPGYGVDVAD